MLPKVEKKDVFWYIVVRLIIVTSILIAAVIILLSGAESVPMGPVFSLLLAVYVLSAAYFLFYALGKHYAVQAYVQVIFDLFLITAFVYISGGIGTSTYFLYLFAIIAASLVISGNAAYLTASLSAILFGLLVDGQYFGIIPYFTPEQAVVLSLGEILFNMFIAWSTFFVIAFMMNYLAGNLKKTREALRQTQKELIIKERLAEAGRISATLAHEIRNPLAAISGSVQVLKAELALKDDQKELMDIVLKESSRVSQSLDQFLDFAYPMKPVFSRIDLTEILDETLKMLRGSGELDGSIALEGNFRDVRVAFTGNGGQFRQVYWNIIKNAIKAMPAGGTLRIDFLEERERLKLLFTDTGIGMTDEDKAHLFEPFYSGFENGRGLGMAGVRRILDDYEGTIEVDSELNKGAKIMISLPLRRP